MGDFVTDQAVPARPVLQARKSALDNRGRATTVSTTGLTNCCGRAGLDMSAGGGSGAVATFEITEVPVR